ncbi:hypothetical protein [Dethiobacter alkaliphilus]|uniref:DUF1440 domain-containing protein n=1 Tax=Dethiobacter alkaliphilus AHT 1 TaxID=555088 RepID=C0GDB9_DETAL|nr:hypothetical protein [Dethiobacter alkaliphilus]EEG78640.1 conserved hypothetical protein [Dethiobacter alkaliphilus AHT 1]
MLFLKDRFVRGSIAGMIAGIIMNMVSYLLVRILGFGEDLLTDYMAEMLFGRTPLMPVESVVALIGHILFTGTLGVVFVYILTIVDSDYIFYKALAFAWASWFILYSLGILFEVPLLDKNTVSTIIGHGITSTVFGVVLAWVLSLIEKRMLS